jgi:ribosomal protein S18 acetylase RimI-like enzyme
LNDTTISRRQQAAHHQTRIATPEDAQVIGELLHAFNAEFGDPTPGPEAVAQRARALMENDAASFLLVGSPPVGVAAIRFREAIFHQQLDAYLEELYVAPEPRGQGLGRTLLDRVLEFARERGASRIELGTAVDDRAARALYESAGFTNFERPDDPGTRMLFYEREL